MSPVQTDLVVMTEVASSSAWMEPSPAYSPMDFDEMGSSLSVTPENSRSGSPVHLGQDLDKSLIEKINSRIASKDKFFSLEFFPPRTKSGAINLMARLERIGYGNPLFIDVTWHPTGNPNGDLETSSTMIAQTALNYIGLETMLHMTCLGCLKENIHEYLTRCKRLGIRNILALRGDAPYQSSSDEDSPPAESGLKFATELVKQIREDWAPDEFTVCVAGYPQGHPEANSYEEDLMRLKEKVDAGADFVITQLFFKASTFKKFVDDCRAVGIECPILPGVMPIQSYDSLRHIVKLSKLDIPPEIQRVIQPLKGNNDAIRNYGVHQAVEMIRDIFNSGYADGVHIYTLNREVAATSILKRLGLWKSDPCRSLPFKLPANARRSNEEVRPIFWNKRSKTYVYRTRHWDEFPNGRWGNSASPAFGDLKDYYLFYLASRTPQEEQKSMWGSNLESEQDVFDVFTRYLTGEANAEGVKVTKLLFNEECLDPETELIADKLATMNKRGILTINSQPSVNCAPSSDTRYVIFEYIRHLVGLVLGWKKWIILVTSRGCPFFEEKKINSKNNI
jgi:methylenetetrahydrofolate reductase (NADPH)